MGLTLTEIKDMPLKQLFALRDVRDPKRKQTRSPTDDIVDEIDEEEHEVLESGDSAFTAKLGEAIGVEPVVNAEGKLEVDLYG